MARAIKIFLIVIAALVVLLAATVFVVTQVIDPNDFKPQIREQAMTQANLDLEIPLLLGPIIVPPQCPRTCNWRVE